MSERLGRRVLVAALLASAALAMGVHYESEWEAGENYRTTVGAIDADPDAYADRPVYLWLTAESVSERRIVARSGSEAASHPRVIVVPPERGDAVVSGGAAPGDAASGDVVQAFGRIRPTTCDLAAACYRLDAERLVVHDGTNRLRMYLVSAAGGLLALAAFLRRWRFDVGRAAFVPRDAGSSERESRREAGDG